ncbi:hypothetical protein D3C77_535210 [compost metagenome]
MLGACLQIPLVHQHHLQYQCILGSIRPEVKLELLPCRSDSAADPLLHIVQIGAIITSQRQRKLGQTIGCRPLRRLLFQVVLYFFNRQAIVERTGDEGLVLPLRLKGHGEVRLWLVEDPIAII